MKAAGIKELKARLSEYIRIVRSGETILITDRNEVVAELRPVSGRRAPTGTVLEILASLAAEGEITPPRLSREGWTWRPRGGDLPPGTVQRLLDELREER